MDNDLKVIDASEDDGTSKIVLGFFGRAKLGKTFSALSLANGLGGTILLVNTEPKRGNLYKTEFQYKLMNFDPPFSSERFNQILDIVEKNNFATVIFDSMTDQWEGPGGILDAHDKACEALIERWSRNAKKRKTRDDVGMAAWNGVKTAERMMFDRMLRMDANIIFCVRQRKKLKITKEGGKTRYEDQGDQPVVSQHALFMTTANIELTGNGHYKPLEAYPKPLQPIMGRHKTITQELGRDIGQWLRGDTKPAVKAPAASPPAPAEDDFSGSFDDLEDDNLSDEESLFNAAKEVYDRAKAEKNRKMLIDYLAHQPKKQKDLIAGWLKERRFEKPTEELPL